MRSVPVEYFQVRWSGKVTLTRLFWLDMLTIATALNLFFAFVSLLMMAKRVDWPWILAVHAVILPYNIFLVFSVWQHAHTRIWMKVVSAIWLVVVAVV
jgi:hypothetical protein